MVQEQDRLSTPEIKKPLCRAYHWTNAARLPEIRSGSAIREPGLWPSREAVFFDWQTFTPVTKGPFTFCFMGSPYPEEWQKHPDLYETLLKLKIGPDLALISFDVFERDEPWVSGDLLLNGGGQQRSEVPLKDYQGNFERLELLIPVHIPLERLTFEPIPDFVRNF